jgi:multidrug transporter EmrE-like cation transporter
LNHRFLNAITFAAYVSASSIGLFILKSSLAQLDFSSLRTLIHSPATAQVLTGACFYIFSFGIWLYLLAQLPLSIAYPIAIGLTATCTTAGSIIFLDEHLSVLKLIGIAMVSAGAVLLSMPES